MALIFIILLRLIIPFSMFWWPLLGIVATLVADAADYGAISQSFIGPHNYQYVDKLLDTYYLVIMLIVSRRWDEPVAKRMVLGLFIYRMFGEALFFITGKEWLLFFFPSLSVDFFLIYVLFEYLTGSSRLIRSRRDLLISMTVLLLPKLLSEYYLHVYRVVALPIPLALTWLYSLNNNEQILVYATLPLMYLGWRVWQQKTTQPAIQPVHA